AGRKVIGLTSVDRSQTDYRLPRPLSASDFAVLLSEIAGDAPSAATAASPEPPAATSMPADPEPPVEAQPGEEAPPPPAEAPAPEPGPMVELRPDRPLASWLGANGLERRVRLQRDGGPVLLVAARSRLWHGPATLKPLTAYFDGTLVIGDFEPPDAATWEAEAAKLGAAQPLTRLQWLGGLLGGHGA